MTAVGWLLGLLVGLVRRAPIAPDWITEQAEQRARDRREDEHYRALAALAPDDGRLPCDCPTCDDSDSEIAYRFACLVTEAQP